MNNTRHESVTKTKQYNIILAIIIGTHQYNIIPNNTDST